MSTPNARAVILEPGGGERIAVGAATLSIKAGSATTGGTFFMSETTIEPGFPGPPPHVHDRLHDMFYVLEGVLTAGHRAHLAGSGGPPTPAEMGAIASRYDFRPAPPPER